MIVVNDSLTYSVSVSTDLTDVTLVSDDTCWRLDVSLAIEDTDEDDDDDDEGFPYQAMKVIKWWKLSSNENYQVMKFIKWWKLSSDESY